MIRKKEKKREKKNFKSFIYLMCPTKQSCDSSSCPSHSTRQSDRIKLPSSHHSGPSYGYYPQPYPRYIQYEPYGIHRHPIPSYPSSCYNGHENFDEVYSAIIIIIITIISIDSPHLRSAIWRPEFYSLLLRANIISHVHHKTHIKSTGNIEEDVLSIFA